VIGYFPCNETSTTLQLWGRSLYNTSTYAAALFNSGEYAHSITLDFSLIGWQGAEVQVRDLWQHADLPGTFTGSYSVEVPSHGTNFVLLTKLGS
jgi:alpha-galactosidase